MPEVDNTTSNTNTETTPNPVGRPKGSYTSTVERFQVKHGGIILSAGVGEKGTFVVYGYSDKEGFHSLGQFPQGRYASQWLATEKMMPAIRAFIDADLARPEGERLLAYKTTRTNKPGAKFVDLGESDIVRNSIKTVHPEWTEEQINEAIENVQLAGE